MDQFTLQTWLCRCYLSILQQQQAHAFPKGPQGKGMGRDRMSLASWLVQGRNEKSGGASRVNFVLTALCPGAWPVILTVGHEQDWYQQPPPGQAQQLCFSSDIWVLCHFPDRQHSSTAGGSALRNLQPLCSRSIPLCLDVFPFSKQAVLQMRRSMYKGTLKFGRSTLYMSDKRRSSLCKEQLLKFDQTGSQLTTVNRTRSLKKGRLAVIQENSLHLFKEPGIICSKVSPGV